MKKDRLKTILLQAAALLLLAACTQDELTEQTGTALPEPIPLQLTATGLYEAIATPANTRGTIDGDWGGAKNVAVRVNNVVKEYTAKSIEGGSALLVPVNPIKWSDADLPFWWEKSTDSKTVEAWHPYNNGTLPSEWTVLTTQTAETIAAEDLMYAYKRDMQVSDQSMTFNHMLSKVVINLLKSNYLEKAQTIAVSLDGQYEKSSFSVSDGNATIAGAGTNDAVIHPYQLSTPNADYIASYQALVVPLTATAGANSYLCITVDGATYKYKLSSAGTSNDVFTSGYQYTYNVSVDAKGLTVSAEQDINWNENLYPDKGSVTLPTEIDLSQATGDITIDDAQTYLLTGTGSYPVKINGDATVILQDVELTTSTGNAISVESGNPTIHVKGTSNSVTGTKAGIYVAQNSTLTITGDSRSDRLTATGKNGSCGIGGYMQSYTSSLACGNISITNVTVNARGSNDLMGSYAPGIGYAGNATGGTITIDNATVHAYGCHDYSVASSPGIGCSIPSQGVSSSIPVVTINGQSDVYVHRGNTYSFPTDYIGWGYGTNNPTAASSTINCGTGGGVYSSTVYCYTGDLLDKTVVYDENGNGYEQ